MKKIIAACLMAGLIAACKKDPVEDITPADNNLSTAILSDFSEHVAQATYNDLKNQADALYQSVLTFNTSSTDPNLVICKQAWRDARSAWEQSEGFLFGPVSTGNIDPRIDTWPVNYTDLDSVLNSSSLFTAGYVDSLEDALKGFHPIEYLLFGVNGNKVAADFTAREKDYLVALAANLQVLTTELAGSWNPSQSGSYHPQFTQAGNGSTTYGSQRAAFEELVNALVGICDEVANGKIAEPFTLQDPGLEESPFAFNSITDFTNNIRSVENVYKGKYTADGKGLEDIVREHNLSLDSQIKNKILTALAALNNITVPFGQAITQQPVQIQNAINAINDLKATLENDLLPFVQQHSN